MKCGLEGVEGGHVDSWAGWDLLIPIQLSVPNLTFMAETLLFLGEENSPSLTARLEGCREAVWVLLELEVEAS